MTESEWLEGQNSLRMFDYLENEGPSSPRKLRLYLCSCCRSVWDFLIEQESQLAVIVAEQFADGLLGPIVLEEAFQEAYETAYRLRGSAYQEAAAEAAYGVAAEPPLGDGVICYAASAAGYAAAYSAYGAGPRADSEAHDHGRNSEYKKQAGLLQCVFGNPFSARRPTEPNWLTDTVVRLATASYEERLLPQGHLDPMRLGVLADALEDAGCNNREVLGHLRRPDAVHVRGCWVLDLLLNKS